MFSIFIHYTYIIHTTLILPTQWTVKNNRSYHVNERPTITSVLYVDMWYK